MKKLEELFTNQKYGEFIADYKSIEDKMEDLDKLALKPMLALSYFHTEEYALSTTLFSQMCEFSKDINLWFNLATSAVLNGEYDKGSAALEKAIQHYQELSDEDKGKCIPIPYMLLYITNAFIDKEQYDLAFARLHQLASIYIQVKVTDTQFLYERGIPSFDDFSNQVENILPKQKQANANDWLNILASHVDEEGATKLEEIGTRLV